MLEVKKIAITLNEAEIVELESIIIDRDDKAALEFLKKSVYDKVSSSQRGKGYCNPNRLLL